MELDGIADAIEQAARDHDAQRQRTYRQLMGDAPAQLRAVADRLEAMEPAVRGTLDRAEAIWSRPAWDRHANRRVQRLAREARAIIAQTRALLEQRRQLRQLADTIEGRPATYFTHFPEQVVADHDGHDVRGRLGLASAPPAACERLGAIAAEIRELTALAPRVTAPSAALTEQERQSQRAPDRPARARRAIPEDAA